MNEENIIYQRYAERNTYSHNYNYGTTPGTRFN